MELGSWGVGKLGSWEVGGDRHCKLSETIVSVAGYPVLEFAIDQLPQHIDDEGHGAWFRINGIGPNIYLKSRSLTL